MAQQLTHIDISHKPELLDLVEQVQSADQALLLRRGDVDVAILRPVKRPSKRVARGGILTHEDPLFSLVGIGQSKILGGVSGKKHDYLLEAYRQRKRGNRSTRGDRRPHENPLHHHMYGSAPSVCESTYLPLC